MLDLWPQAETPGVSHFGAYHRPPDGHFSTFLHCWSLPLEPWSWFTLNRILLWYQHTRNVLFCVILVSNWEKFRWQIGSVGQKWKVKLIKIKDVVLGNFTQHKTMQQNSAQLNASYCKFMLLVELLLVASGHSSFPEKHLKMSSGPWTLCTNRFLATGRAESLPSGDNGF